MSRGRAEGWAGRVVLRRQAIIDETKGSNCAGMTERLVSGGRYTTVKGDEGFPFGLTCPTVKKSRSCGLLDPSRMTLRA
jgi:hypothetical protein